MRDQDLSSRRGVRSVRDSLGQVDITYNGLRTDVLFPIFSQK